MSESSIPSSSELTSALTASPPLPDRRAFFKKAAALIFGGAAAAIPAGAGVAAFLDPLWKRDVLGAQLVRVTNLSELPADGVPRKFEIVADRADAWNKFPKAPIGAVYLRRTGPNAIDALNVVCPHAGCFVDFLAARNIFFCPCHNSVFRLDGAIADPRSPAPRGMDRLAVEIRAGGEIWVRFQNYEAGRAEKTPIS